jgi:DNA repair protein RadD
MSNSTEDILVPDAATQKLVTQYLTPLDTLRYYQVEAIVCCVFRMRKTTDPLLISLPTGSGKSWVIAGLALVIQKMIKERTGQHKKILALAPSAELVEQNHGKMVQAGFPASIYMADLRQKDLSENIVFASPISFDNSVDSILEKAHVFGAVLIDEAHEFTPKIQNTIEKLKAANPNLRVIGLTATPFRMGQGYIYAQDAYRKQPLLTARHTKHPPFAELVYEKTAEQMIVEGYLAPPLIGNIEAHYDTAKLKRTPTGGSFTDKSNLEVFVEGKEELTRKIVEDVIRQSRNRKGVMFFAQNRRHAREILSYLPEGEAALIDSETDKRHDRPQIIRDFKNQKLKYLVNVGTLVKGFDAPHVDVIAILAHTESDARRQQILGRGFRPCPETGKLNCLILDYGENLPKNGNILNPRIKLADRNKTGEHEANPIDVLCPICDNLSEFPRAKIPDDTVVNTYGYLVSAGHGGIVSTDKGEPIAGHLGTQCHYFYYPDPEGLPIRCPQTWGTLVCEVCNAINSHRAEYCESCDAFLQEANNRLSLIPSRPDGPYSPRLAQVLGGFRMIPGTSRSGNPTLRVIMQVQELPYFVMKLAAIEDDEAAGIKAGDVMPEDVEGVECYERETLVEPEPIEIQVWLNPTVKHPKAQKGWAAFMAYVSQFTEEPLSVPEDEVPNFLLRFAPNNAQAIPVEMPGYITYCEQQTAANVDRTFYEILDFHLTHPYAPENAVSADLEPETESQEVQSA